MSRLPPRQQVLAETATPTRVKAAASRRQSAAAATSNKYRALCTPSRASTAPKPTTLKRLLITHGKTDDVTKKRKCDPMMPMASRKTSMSMSMSNTGGIATTGGTDEAVKVAVRVRPIVPEGNQCADRAWGVSTEQNSIVELSSESKDPYEYDQVFGEDSNTRTIYDALVSGVVSSVAKDGINGTVFTYGQTGSGKTFTMQGCKKSKSDGIVQLAARDIFQSIKNNDNEDDAVCTVRVSYVEIYNEELRDLLNDNSRKSSSSLEIREDKQGVIIVEGLKEVVVKSLEDLMKIFNAGEQKRSVGSTKMNDRSSRSHAILSVTLERKTTTSAPKYDANEQKENSDHNRAPQSKLVVVKTTSTLKLVDLAGSESVRHTNAVGKQKEEGGMINQSLLTLYMVLTSLGKNSPEQHIKYRNSKLTRILKPSLSGNARIVVVCCISPSSKFIQETQSTLQFASRAKLVKTNANINETVEGADAAAQLKVELGRSRVECNSLNEQLREQNSHNAVLKTMNYALKEENDELKKQHAATMEELCRCRSEVHALEGQLRVKDQLRELKASTALHEHKSEITNIATSANDDDCQTFEKYASLADNSTTDSGYSDSKDDDISIRSDCSDHCESINFSEEEEKTMLMKEEEVMEAEEEVINVCDFGGYGIEEEKDDITITNSTGGAPATTRRSGTSRNHSVIDLCNDDEEYIDNVIVEIEDGNDGKIVFLDLDETHGISTTTSRTSVATIASTGNCEEEEEEKEEDGNDGRDNSHAEEYESDEEDDSSETRKSLNKRTIIDTAIYCGSRRCSTVTRCEEQEEVEDDEDGNDSEEDDDDSKDAEFEFDKDDDSNGTSQSMEEDNSDEEVECNEDDGSDGASPIHPIKKRTRTGSTTIEDSGLTKNAVIQQPSSSSHLPTKSGKWKIIPWNKRIKQLIRFNKEHGHCNVPYKYEADTSLGLWVSKQRKNYSGNRMKQERIDELNDLGFVWDAYEAAWLEYFMKLVQFKKEHGHCNVPQKYEADPSLGTWVSKQRQNYRNFQERKPCKGMNKERIDKLNHLGFVWNALEATWLEYFMKLVQFKNEHGHCNVPQKYKADTTSLGSWVDTQRQNYQKFQEGKPCKGMNDERIRKLEDLGFVWRIR